MNVKNFIQNLLINEIKSIQQRCGHHYHSFSLIAQGIEFYGACLDSGGFFTPNRSGKRFNKALVELFPVEYQNFITGKGNQFDLYENLRCGLLHAVLPKGDVELIKEAEVPLFGNHLEVKVIRDRERLVLVSQQFMADFENAGLEIIRRIDNREIAHSKVYGEYMSNEP